MVGPLDTGFCMVLVSCLVLPGLGICTRACPAKTTGSVNDFGYSQVRHLGLDLWRLPPALGANWSAPRSCARVHHAVGVEKRRCRFAVPWMPVSEKQSFTGRSHDNRQQHYFSATANDARLPPCVAARAPMGVSPDRGEHATHWRFRLIARADEGH